MNVTKFAFQRLLAIAAASWASIVCGADEVKAPPRGLSPEQIRSVQFVGRAVLSAKHSEVEDPQYVELRERVRDLRKTLDAVAGVSPDANVTTGSSPEQPERRRARESRANLDDFNPLTQDLRARRRAMQAGRVTLEQEIRRRPREDRQGELHAAAARKVQEIETDLEEALNAPAENRRARLLKLRARLSDNRLQHAPTEERPTFSTIIRHRE
jgi:hypothetical protein